MTLRQQITQCDFIAAFRCLEEISVSCGCCVREYDCAQSGRRSPCRTRSWH